MTSWNLADVWKTVAEQLPHAPEVSLPLDRRYAEAFVDLDTAAAVAELVDPKR